ncbi:MAG TPA: HAMP domain-containing sensor histidine kinase [Candidatus Acidoferrum sp.]|nr:HAMP domain-containing sensor histidine kinase [Candidatus Acidoferrum sp.]
MSETRRIAWLVAAWAVFLGFYAGVSFYLKPGASLSAFGDIMQCFVPLIANAGLLVNAGTPHWRRNIFWMLLALSTTMWMMGQFEWTYYEVYLHREVPDPFAGDIIFFLRGIPLIAALALQPHLKREELRMGLGYLDFALLLTWWTFAYAFFVLPWMYVSYSGAAYNYAFNVLNTVQQLVVIVGFGVFWLRTRNAWRTIYAYLFTASAVYMLTSLATNVAISRHDYYTGSVYDLPLLTVFFLYGLGGLVAFQRRHKLDLPGEGSLTGATEGNARGTIWAARLAMGAVLSLPLFALYSMHLERDAQAIRDFRLTVTLIAAVPLVLLVFLRTHLADKDRAQLLAKSESSIENLQRLQAQLVQSEKLISLGQLAAGAAHEINNPLTAILGYSDLLADDPALPDRARTVAGKIREQGRRTRNLVQNLLSFARQVPPERTLLDINSVISNAVQLRALDLHKGGPRIETELESVLPGVRGDNNQLMQVFFNILNNALDAMGNNSGGVLTIKTQRDRGSVVILFSDTGPGIKEPHRVFDPFYTTKPVGKGTGLGLSICYGIVQEHGGKILCYNGQKGGAVFRVELPAVLAVLPTKGTGATPVPSKQP